MPNTDQCENYWFMSKWLVYTKNDLYMPKWLVYFKNNRFMQRIFGPWKNDWSILKKIFNCQILVHAKIIGPWKNMIGPFKKWFGYFKNGFDMPNTCPCENYWYMPKWLVHENMIGSC